MRGVLCLGLFLATAALGATWQPGSLEIPTLDMSVSLGGGQPLGVGNDGEVFVVFQDFVNDTTLRVGSLVRAADGEWMSAEILSGDRNARNPSVSVGQDSRAHVVWEDITDGEGDIVYRARGADGVWGEAISIAPAPGASRDPVLAVDAFERVHAVWVDARSGLPQILHSVLPPDGPWAAPEVISVGGDNPDEPSVAADAVGGVHIVWRDRVGSVRTGISYDIFYLRIEGMEPPPAPLRLINHVSIAQWPAIAATDDGVLHLVWADNRDAQRGTFFEIYYKRFLPGIGWGHDKRFTRDNHDHSRPVVAVGAGATVNVAWEDFGDGNSEIYFRQITPEFGWDQTATRLSLDVSSSQTPALRSLPDGSMLALWTDARGFGDFRLLAKSGATLAPQ
jgi:hypothetical protein